MITINKIWIDWRNLPFPRDLKQEHITGINLNELVTQAERCIETFLEKKGTLNKLETDLLEKCRSDLRKINPTLVGDAQVYFGKLYRMCDLVLDNLNSHRQ